MDVEFVSVSAYLPTGKEIVFNCSAFDWDGAVYTFISYPRRRGFKTVRLLRNADFASLQITAPEMMFEVLKRQSVPASRPVTTLTYRGDGTEEAAMTSSPQVFVNPISAAVRDAKANVSKALPSSDGTPQSAIVDNKTGTPRLIRVGAAMV